MSNGPEGI